MASFLDVCRFTAASSGTGDFVVSAAVTGYQTPASAGAVNATVYRYRAESSDLSQWEVGYGAYTTGTTTLARTTVLFNSSGTTSKISFSAAPQVSIVALAEDLVTFGDASTNTSSSVDGEMALFSSTGGKTFKRSTLTGGLLKSTSGVPVIATAGTDYVDKGATSTFTVGFKFTPNNLGTVTSGTTTLDPALGNYQVIINGGASTIAPPASGTFDAIDLLVINGPSAGSITLSGAKWRVGSSTGSSYSTSVRSSATATMTIASPCVVSWTSHGCADGDPVYFTTSGALPTGVAASTVYYVKYIDANSFNLAATPGGSSINTSGSQSGTHTASACSQYVFSARQIYGAATYSWYALQ